MSTQITTAFVQSYRANIELLLQQKGSKLEATVRREEQGAEFDFYDRIGQTAAQKRTSRHQDTPLMNTPHDRRRVALEDYEWADLIDQADKIRLITDPAAAYTQNAVFALGRSKDDEIIAAATGTASTGKTGSASTVFLVANVVAVDYVESGSTANSGLTIGKLRKTKELLDAAENEEDEMRTCAVTARQITDLLRTTEVTSGDFNTVRALAEGRIDTYMGFKFKRCQRLATDGDSYRRVLAYVQSGLLLAVGVGAKDLIVRVTERADKSYSTQVFAAGSFGSVRMEELKIVEIKCDET